MNFSQLQIECCPSLNGHPVFFGFVDSSTFDAKVLVFGFSRFWNLEFVWANRSSWMKAVDSNQSLNTIKLAARSWWSCRCCNQCFFSWGKNLWFPISSDCMSGWNPSRIKTLTVFVTKSKNRTMLLESSFLTRRSVYKWVEIRLWLSVCQIFCRECPRLDNMPVSWNSFQKLPLLLDPLGLSADTASSQYQTVAFDVQRHRRVLRSRATPGDLLKSQLTWVLATRSDHQSVVKLLVG